jgi:hypothetical protein
MTRSSSPQFLVTTLAVAVLTSESKGTGKKCSLSTVGSDKACMKSTLLGDRVPNMRVLDTLGCLTNSSNPPEQLTALQQLTTKDNVHLTDEGYKALAVGLLKEAISLSEPREKGKNKGHTCQQTTNWNGFVSHSGIGKTSLKGTIASD